MSKHLTDRLGRPLHKAVKMWASEARDGRMNRREFLGRAAALAITSA